MKERIGNSSAYVENYSILYTLHQVSHIYCYFLALFIGTSSSITKPSSCSQRYVRSDEQELFIHRTFKDPLYMTSREWYILLSNRQVLLYSPVGMVWEYRWLAAPEDIEYITTCTISYFTLRRNFTAYASLHIRIKYIIVNANLSSFA